MITESGYTCACCGEFHTELPMGYSTLSPEAWHSDFDDDPDSVLGEEQCVIKAEHFFIRGQIEIPVLDGDTPFSWSVWVSLSRDNFSRSLSLWNSPGREKEQPYFGWLTTSLMPYAVSTLNLATNVHTRPVGMRPLVELEPTDHPLAVEQRTGITMDRVREIAEAIRHGQRAE